MAKPDAPPLDRLAEVLSDAAVYVEDSAQKDRYEVAAIMRATAARLRGIQFVMPGDDDWDAGYNTALSNIADAAAEKP